MKGRIGAVIAAAVLLIAGAAVAFGALYAADWDFHRFTATNIREDTAVVEQSFQTIQVDVTTADVFVLRSPDETCRVHTHEQEQNRFYVDVNGDVLQIRQEDNRKWYDQISFGDGSNSRVEIALPGEVYEELRVELTTGDAAVSQELQFRSVTMDLTTGDVDFKARVTEKLDLQASTGDIHVAAGSSEAEIAIRVTTGNITVSDTVCRTLKLKATTGDIRLKLCDAGSVQAEATTGDISGILLSGKEFRAQTTTGHIDVPENGTDGICDLHTNTGDITFLVKEAAGN